MNSNNLKRVVITVLFVIVTIASFSIKTLEKMQEKLSLISDRDQIPRYFALSDSTIYSNWDQSLNYINKAINVAKISGQKNNEVRALHKKIELLIIDNKLVAAEEIALKALKLSLKLDDNLFIGLSYYKKGEIFYQLNKFSESIDAFENSLTFLRETDSQQDIAKVLIALSISNNKIGKLEEAFNFIYDALQILTNFEENSLTSKSFLIMSCLFVSANKYERSLIFSKRALDISIQIKDYELKELIYYNLGIQYSLLKKSEKAFQYFSSSIKFANQLHNKRNEANSILQICRFYLEYNQFDKCIQNLQNALSIYTLINDKIGILKSYLVLSEYYFAIGKYNISMEYCQLAFDTNVINEDYQFLSSLHNMIAKNNQCLGLLDKSEEHYQMAISYANKKKSSKMQGLTYNNYANFYFKQNKYIKAIEFYQKAVDLTINTDSKFILIDAYYGLLQVYQQLRDCNNILSYADKILELAELNDDFLNISNTYLILYEFYDDEKNIDVAYSYYQKYLTFKEKHESKFHFLKLSNTMIEHQIVQLKNELQQIDSSKQNESNQLEKKKKTLKIVSLSSIFILSIAYIISYLYYKKRNAHAKVQNILHSLLPDEITLELLNNGKNPPENFKNACVCFIQVSNTNINDSNSVIIEYLSELNQIFEKFREISIEYGCTHIKTTGLRYLMVSGVPKENENPNERALEASLAIRDYVIKKNKNSKTKWEIKIGLHSGSLIAGLIGEKKFIYDIFGDSVNTASRMENFSEMMKINVSEDFIETYKHENSSDCIKFTNRGLFEVKGKNLMRMYYAERREVT